YPKTSTTDGSGPAAGISYPELANEVGKGATRPPTQQRCRTLDMLAKRTLRGKGGFAGFVLRDLVRGVLAAVLALAVGVAGFRNVDLRHARDDGKVCAGQHTPRGAPLVVHGSHSRTPVLQQDPSVVLRGGVRGKRRAVRVWIRVAHGGSLYLARANGVSPGFPRAAKTPSPTTADAGRTGGQTKRPSRVARLTSRSLPRRRATTADTETGCGRGWDASGRRGKRRGGARGRRIPFWRVGGDAGPRSATRPSRFLPLAFRKVAVAKTGPAVPAGAKFLHRTRVPSPAHRSPLRRTNDTARLAAGRDSTEMACAGTTYSLEGLETAVNQAGLPVAAWGSPIKLAAGCVPPPCRLPVLTPCLSCALLSQERLTANYCVFDRLVNTIPAKYYVVTDGIVEQQNRKYLHNTRKRAPKQELKEAFHKAKKAKLDPENQKTVSDVQAELMRKKEEESNRGLALNGGSAGVEVGHTGPGASKDGTPMDTDSTTVRPLPTPESISELRQRVQKKIAALQERRRNKSAPPLSRDEILQERTRKKAEMKEKLRKQRKAATGGVLSVAQKTVNAEDEEKMKTARPSNPSVDAMNSNSEIVFSKFVFDGEKSKKCGIDVRSALKKVAESKAEKIASISAEGSAKAAKIAEENAWRRASQLARGDKPKDDVRLLKKTIRKSEQEKAKSAREWKQRQDAVEAGIADRQRRREENIRARVEEKKAGKTGKKGKDKDKKKKKKHRAGFEGR
ncbi:MAG: surfeit locus protein 6-domain-containing protein, partial [Olpidium bornovanus]